MTRRRPTAVPTACGDRQSRVPASIGRAENLRLLESSARMLQAVLERSFVEKLGLVAAAHIRVLIVPHPSLPTMCAVLLWFRDSAYSMPPLKLSGIRCSSPESRHKLSFPYEYGKFHVVPVRHLRVSDNIMSKKKKKSVILKFESRCY
jgi:hypothetical protein